MLVQVDRGRGRRVMLGQTEPFGRGIQFWKTLAACCAQYYVDTFDVNLDPRGGKLMSKAKGNVFRTSRAFHTEAKSFTPLVAGHRQKKRQGKAPITHTVLYCKVLLRTEIVLNIATPPPIISLPRVNNGSARAKQS